jgi:hypothetical protein
MDKNYWKTDNENGYKYQLLAFRNAFSAVINNKEKSIELKGMSWGVIEDALVEESVTYDYDRVYEPDTYQNYIVYIYSTKQRKYICTIEGNHISGEIIICNSNE